MGLGTRLAAAARGFLRPAALQANVSIERAVLPWEVGKPRISSTDVLTLAREGYQQNAVIYGCIQLLAKATLEAPMVWQRGENPLPPRAALLKAWKSPNPDQTWKQWHQRACITYQVGGKVRFHILRSRGGMPIALHVLRNDRLRPVPDSMGGIDYWEYRVTQGSAPYGIDPGDIIELANPNLLDDYDGLSAIQVMAADGDLDNEAVRYLRGYFTNGAIPITKVTVKGNPTEAEAKALADKIEERLRGNRRYRPFVQGEGTDLETLGADPEKLDLGGLFGHTESRICLALGVPPLMVGAWIGLVRSAYNTAEQQERRLWRGTVQPWHLMLADVMTEKFIRPEFGEDLAWTYDLTQVAALQESSEERNKGAIDLYRFGVITRDEARRRTGEKDIDKGEDVFIVGPQAGGEPPAPVKPALPMPVPALNPTDHPQDAPPPPAEEPAA